MPTPTPTFVTQNKGFVDYRPAIANDGTTVIFERTGANGITVLYQVTELDGSTAAPFLPDLSGSQTRPAIDWQTGQVAFNGECQIVRIVQPDGSGLTTVSETTGWDYPQWSADGASLVVENSDTGGLCPFPVNTEVQISNGKVTIPNMNGSLNSDASVPMFGGMPGLNPVNNAQFAAATQPQLSTWSEGVAQNKCGYNQNANQIFLGDTSSSSFVMAPMEPGASGDTFNVAYQGRAPQFSPDGKWVVFESNRHNNSYSLYLFKLGSTDPAIRLTKSKYGAQHAKFFPCGTKLIFVGAGTNSGKKGIAWIDISYYVS